MFVSSVINESKKLRKPSQLILRPIYIKRMIMKILQLIPLRMEANKTSDNYKKERYRILQLKIIELMIITII